MKRSIFSYFPVLPVALVMASMMFPWGCANTTEAPSGGPRDTIPPVLYNIKPLPGATNVPLHNAKVTFVFNEYVKVKDPKGINLSPPQKKSPRYKLKGKSLVVWFEEDLLPNTTYTIDLTNALADNNEDNMFQGYTYCFSTGSIIDSMMISGVVQDCNTLEPVKGATVMLYKDASDSAIFLKRPDASVKTDDWGFFCLRNISDTLYRLYAIKDESSNNIYDPDQDLIAFCDSSIRPSIKINDTIPELLKYDMKDTLNVMARKTPYELNLFREKPSKQFIRNKQRIDERSAYITFNAPGANIHELWVRGLPSDRIITQFNIQKDSLEIWINDARRMPDTLHLMVNYDKPDSTGVIVAQEEEVNLFMENRKSFSKSSRRNLKHEDTICVYSVEAKPENIEQDGFILEFRHPVIIGDFDKIEFRSRNPRQQETRGTFKLERDTTNLRRWVIRPNEKYQEGHEYFMKVPAHIFCDINGFWNDSTETRVSLPKDKDMCSISLEMKNVHNKYIVDLLDKTRKKVLRSYVTESDGTLLFPYLKAGSYYIRVTEDLNRNGIVDTGSLLEGRQPEKVRFFKIAEKTMIDIPSRTDLVQPVDVEAMFKE